MILSDLGGEYGGIGLNMVKFELVRQVGLLERVEIVELVEMVELVELVELVGWVELVELFNQDELDE